MCLCACYIKQINEVHIRHRILKNIFVIILPSEPYVGKNCTVLCYCFKSKINFQFILPEC